MADTYLMINGKQIKLVDNSDGSFSVANALTGSKPQEPFNGSTTVTHAFTKSMSGFGITNDGASDLTFTIGADTYTVKAGETWEYPVDAFAQVTITTGVAYRAWGLI